MKGLEFESDIRISALTPLSRCFFSAGLPILTLLLGLPGQVDACCARVTSVFVDPRGVEASPFISVCIPGGSRAPPPSPSFLYFEFPLDPGFRRGGIT